MYCYISKYNLFYLLDKGIRGDEGAIGLIGFTGIYGIKGEQGDTGPEGLPGMSCIKYHQITLKKFHES